MKRNLDFNEISDGKLYTSGDLAKVSCGGCVNCSECCEVTEDTILLDPYDIYELSRGLSQIFEKLMEDAVGLTVIDGVITPYLKKHEALKACVFLSSDKRCLIHDFRPGFCRLFPLGRIYDEEGNFKYFIQVHECPYPSKSKVKIEKWLGIKKLSQYEQFIREWHEISKNLSDCTLEDPASPLAKKANMKLLNTFFVRPYDTEKDFYSQFAERKKLYFDT